MERERSAWHALEALPRGCPAPARLELLSEWLDAMHAVRESSATRTAVAAHQSRLALQECVEALTTPAAGLETAMAPPVPECGQHYLGRDGSAWHVTGIVHDELEPELYCVRIDKRGARAVDNPHEVYCEDWLLFCVVHGLQPDEA